MPADSDTAWEDWAESQVEKASVDHGGEAGSGDVADVGGMVEFGFSEPDKVA